MIRNKNSMDGFSHIAALIGFLIIVGVSGSFMVVASYAYYKNPQCDSLVKKYKITGGSGVYDTGESIPVTSIKHFLAWCTKKQPNDKSGSLSLDIGSNKGIWRYDYSQNRLLKNR